MCELLKTLLHQVHCPQLSRGRVWAVYVASGPWNHALACHLSGKWLLAGIPSRLKVLHSLGPSQRSLILRVYLGKDVWKAKGNLQGRCGVGGLPLRRALWRTGREKSSLFSIFATWKMTRVRSKDKDSFKLGREEMLLEISSCCFVFLYH